MEVVKTIFKRLFRVRQSSQAERPACVQAQACALITCEQTA